MQKKDHLGKSCTGWQDCLGVGMLKNIQGQECLKQENHQYTISCLHTNWDTLTSEVAIS